MLRSSLQPLSGKDTLLLAGVQVEELRHLGAAPAGYFADWYLAESRQLPHSILRPAGIAGTFSTSRAQIDLSALWLRSAKFLQSQWIAA